MTLMQSDTELVVPAHHNTMINTALTPCCHAKWLLSPFGGGGRLNRMMLWKKSSAHVCQGELFNLTTSFASLLNVPAHGKVIGQTMCSV